MSVQSPRSLTRDNFGTPPWESWEKVSFGCGSRGGGGFPRVRAVVSQVSPRSPAACPNTKWMQNDNTKWMHNEF